MLQVKPNVKYVDWLIEHIASEKPFISYAAIEALRRAAQSNSERQTLITKLRNWLQTADATEFMRGTNDRVELLKGVLSQLGIEPPPRSEE
jgi:hypothetical protein